MTQMNNEQLSAVSFTNGTMLLIAGPGSGKTFVLTHRIKALIDSGVNPSHILVITFTKAAAMQMQTRFNLLSAHADSPVTFGTFHAIFYSILKNHRLYRNVEPITEKEKLNMIKRALEIAELNSVCENIDEVIQTLNIISACKNNGNNPKEFGQDKYESDEFVRLYEAYQDLLKEFGKIDFDDMVNDCLELLMNDDAYLHKWQERYKYILVDEFQDISSNQYELVKLLAYPEYNIFAVGDDDQSIYMFRGARVELMQKLLTDISDARKQFLSVNYRSSEFIVSNALQVINDNKNRFVKDISAHRQDKGIVNIKCLNNDTEEHNYIIDLIRQLLTTYEPGEIAILTRTNKYASIYAALLRAHDIPCDYMDNSMPFSSSYIKDICAYLDYANGNKSREVFLRIVNRPIRYVKRAAINEGIVNEKYVLDFYKNDIKMSARLKLLFDQLSRIKVMSPYLALKYVRNVIGYDSYVKDNVSFQEYNNYLQEVEAFAEFIKGIKSINDIWDMLYKVQATTERANKEVCGIKLYTYHGSKGLEFKAVILPDVNEGIVPPKSAHLVEEIEEERRMLYVAMTRAQDELYILYHSADNRKVSRFIAKLVEK